jgi:hypothetical protein
MRDITIMVTSATGATYPPFYMTVYAPSRDVPEPDKNMDMVYNCNNVKFGCNPNVTLLGYVSYIHYQTQNQFGDVLGFLTDANPSHAALDTEIPINENWTETYSAPSPMGLPANNWPVDGQCYNASKTCGNQYPIEWEDQLAAASTYSSGVKRSCSRFDYGGPALVPQPIPPQRPLCPTSTLVTKLYNGGWWVGGTTSGTGVKVQSNIWLSYIDHGRHQWSPP